MNIHKDSFIEISCASFTDDNIAESSETIIVTLSNPQNISSITTASKTLEITKL